MRNGPASESRRKRRGGPASKGRWPSHYDQACVALRRDVLPEADGGKSAAHQETKNASEQKARSQDPGVSRILVGHIELRTGQRARARLPRDPPKRSAPAAHEPERFASLAP